MRPFIILCVLSAATSALAKPWNGITPGKSKKADVIEKFGQPSKQVNAGGREVYAYLKDRAIKSTVQAQFKVDPATGVVDRIDVFPAVDVSRADVVDSYGKECPEKPPAGPNAPDCFLKRTDGKRVYYLYSALGLAIFFKEDSDQVQSMTFLPQKQP
jgi:hypothetical protein